MYWLICLDDEIQDDTPIGSCLVQFLNFNDFYFQWWFARKGDRNQIGDFQESWTLEKTGTLHGRSWSNPRIHWKKWRSLDGLHWQESSAQIHSSGSRHVEKRGKSNRCHHLNIRRFMVIHRIDTVNTMSIFFFENQFIWIIFSEIVYIIKIQSELI